MSKRQRKAAASARAGKSESGNSGRRTREIVPASRQAAGMYLLYTCQWTKRHDAFDGSAGHYRAP